MVTFPVAGPRFQLKTNWLATASGLVQAVRDCAPEATNDTRQVGDRSPCASASEMRAPSSSPKATLIGTVWPPLHFEVGAGVKKPRTLYWTTYETDTVAWFPARSRAV